MDTILSTHPSLVGLGTDVPQRAMTPLTVIVGFDVFKHGFPHLDAAYEVLTVDAFDFQAVEEALRTRIVVAVAFCAHAALQVMSADQILISRRAVLAAAVAVYDHPLGLLTSPQRHA